MSIFTLQTKQALLVDVARNITAKIKFDFMAWHKLPSGYKAEFAYYYDKVVQEAVEGVEAVEAVEYQAATPDTPEVLAVEAVAGVVAQDAVVEKVYLKDLANIIDLDNATTNALASQITPTATTYVEKEREFLIAGSFAIINSDGLFSLTKDDWELVVE